MHIVICGYSLTPVSGHCRSLFEIRPELERLGFKISIFTDKYNDYYADKHKALTRETKIDFSVNESDCTGSLDSHLQDPSFLQLLEEANVFHAFDMKAALWLKKQLSKRRSHSPVVYNMSTFPLVDRRSMFSGPRVFTRMFDLFRRDFLISTVVPKALLARAYAKVDHIVTTCPDLQDFLVELGVSRERTTSVYPAINETVFSPQARVEKDTFTILYYGWFSDIRGVSFLFEAFREAYRTNPKLRLVYTTTNFHHRESKWLKSRIERIAASESLPVTVMGYSPDIAKLVADADLVALPFVGRYGYLHPPMTMLEAVFRKRVVLTTRIGSIPGVVDEDLLLVDTPHELAERIQAATVDYQPFQDAVDRLYTCTSQEFSVSEIARQYAEVYRAQADGAQRYVAREIYSQSDVAEGYDEKRFTSTGGLLFDKLEMDIVRKYVPSDHGSRIMEVGSGTGRFIINLAKDGYTNLRATDISPALLDVLRRKAAAAGMADRIDTGIGDIYKLEEFADGTFDCVYSIRVLNQLRTDENRADAIRSLLRVVKPGGRLIVDVINARSLGSLVTDYPLTSLSRFRQTVLESGYTCRISATLHRMSLSQTLMEKAGWPMAYAVYGIDRVFSSILPFFGTRVYYVIEKDA